MTETYVAPKSRQSHPIAASDHHHKWLSNHSMETIESIRNQSAKMVSWAKA